MSDRSEGAGALGEKRNLSAFWDAGLLDVRRGPKCRTQAS